MYENGGEAMLRLQYAALFARCAFQWLPAGSRSAYVPAGFDFYRVRPIPGLAPSEAKPEPIPQGLDFAGTSLIARACPVQTCIAPDAAIAGYRLIERHRM
jgi:hypothetical protein